MENDDDDFPHNQTQKASVAGHSRMPADAGAGAAVFSDTVEIFVDAEWGSSGTQPGVQLCPALFVPSVVELPKAVKHIYSRLSSAASNPLVITI